MDIIRRAMSESSHTASGVRPARPDSSQSVKSNLKSAALNPKLIAGIFVLAILLALYV
jgi:hypothetical protein